MSQPAYRLDRDSRPVVLEAIVEVCGFRGWRLLGTHVRGNHVHVVVGADDPPGKTMSDFEAYASRALNRLGRDEVNRRRWARHGSTGWLWKD